MKITIITLFPRMIAPFFNESIIKKAIEKKLVEIEIINLRDFGIDKRGTVDDRPYGGGAGMILRVEPIYDAIQFAILNFKFQISKKNRRIILTSPKGKPFDQKSAVNYSKLNHLIIIAGHYEGVDERILDFVDEEISIGDFVLTGGEIAAAAVVDSVVRLIPGVLRKQEATKVESFFEVDLEKLIKVVGEDKFLKSLVEKGVKKVNLLEYPQYTRPEEFKGKKVPEILLSGNHQQIEKWRLKKAYEETLKKRKDLLT